MKYTFLISVVIVLAACGGNQDTADTNPAEPALTAATLGEQNVFTAAEYMAQEPYASADVANGARLATLCLACHSMGQGGAHMIGPNLHGFFGARVASKENFDYSAVLRESTFIWTPRALDAWMTDPGGFLPGNRMTIAGIRNAQDRHDVIAYLLKATTTTP